jgi:hypothetical protein
VSVHQCPKCELRYRDINEVREHLIAEHGVEPETLERHLSGLRTGVHERRRAPDPTPGSRRDGTTS